MALVGAEESAEIHVAGSGPPVDDRRLALRLSLLTAALFATLGVYLPFFPVWLASRGLNDSEIGLVLALPVVMPILANPPVGAFADQYGSVPKSLLACTAAAVAGFVALGLARGFLAILVVGVLLAAARSPLAMLGDALAFAELRRRPAIPYGRVRLWGSAAVLVGMLIGGWIVGLLPREGIVWILAATSLLGAAASLWAISWASGSEAREAVAATKPIAREHSVLLHLVIAAAALVNASHALLNSFGSLHWRAIGCSASFIGTAWALGVAAEIATFFIAARLFGERRAPFLIVIGAIGAAIRWLIMATDPSPAVLVLLQTMHSTSFAATHLGSVLTIARVVPAARRARALARLTAAIALGTGTMTLLSGPFYGWAGERAYLGMALVAATGLAVAAVATAKSRAERAAAC